MLTPNQQYQFVRLTSSGLVKNGSGLLGGFLVATGTPTITLYDSLTGTGTLIVNGIVCAASTAYPVPAQFVKGCYAVISSSADVTFFYN